MLRTFRRKAWANLAGVAGVAGGLLMCLAGSVYGTLAAEDQQPGTPSKPVLVPPPAPPEPSQTAPQPDYAPFPGIWFDYLPDVVSADNGWEMQFRVGLAGQTAVQAQFLDADRKPLKTVTLPDPTTPDDFAHGKLSVLTLAVPADLHAAFVRLIAQSSVQNGVQPAGVQVEIELRSAANADAGVDLRLASLPPRARAGSAENLVAEAQAPGSGMRGLTWGCLGARLCAADGHPVVLSVHPRAPQVDRSGLVTGVFRPPAPPDPNAPARRTLIVAPAVLGPTLAAALNIAQVQAIPVRHLGGRAGSGTSSVAPSSSPAASSGPAAAPANSSVTRLVLAPQATRDEPFHPMAGCLAAALAAIDRPDNADL